MAAPRATQWIALRNLARGSHSAQIRPLHMTGPATHPSPALMRERPLLDLPRDIASLRAECRRRRIDHAGSQQDLIKRINANELTQSRAFTAAVDQSRRPTPSSSSDGPSYPLVRQFNITRSLKSPGDTSTIDFAFLPDMGDQSGDSMAQIRVPILPSTTSPPRTGAHAPEVEETVMRPQILHVSSDNVYLPMSENTDGHAMNIDFHAMADRIANNLRRMQVPVEERAGMMKQLWNDMVDDMMTVASKATPSSTANGKLVLPRA